MTRFFFFHFQGNKDLEKEIIDRKAISLVCEYIENCDAEASYADVCSDFHPTNMSLVAEKIIGMILIQTKYLIQFHEIFVKNFSTQKPVK